MLTIQARNMAIVVAKATPETPSPNTATRMISSTMLTKADTIRKYSDALLSPSPLKIPAFIL